MTAVDRGGVVSASTPKKATDQGSRQRRRLSGKLSLDALGRSWSVESAQLSAETRVIAVIVRHLTQIPVPVGASRRTSARRNT